MMQRFCAILMVVVAAAWPAQAEVLPEAGAGIQTTEDRRAVQQAEAYLNGLTTVKADFTQIAPDGSASFGTFFLSRPGKLRWQYNPPVPILIVANGSTLAYHDFELDQISHVPTESTLAGFLARPNISFSGDITVSEVVRGGGVLRLTLHETGKKEEGQMTLIFDEYPMRLQKLEVLDATKQLTAVSFSDAEYEPVLDDKLFFIDYTKRTKKKKN